MNSTEQAHKNLRNVLLRGRILINGLPPTGLELDQLISQEQMLYAKASAFDKAQEVASAKKNEDKIPETPKGGNQKEPDQKKKE